MRLFCIITRFWCGRQELNLFQRLFKSLTPLIYKGFSLRGSKRAPIYFLAFGSKISHKNRQKLQSTGQNPVGFLFTNMMENNFKFRNQFFIKQVGIVRKLQNLWIGKFFPRIEVNHRYATMPYIKPCRKDRVKNIQLKGSVSIGNLILQLSHSLRQIQSFTLRKR